MYLSLNQIVIVVISQNPRNGFLPGAGQLLYLKPPQEADNVRVETGVRENDEVSVHYDPMIAKLVVWRKDRSEALSILRSKLNEYNVSYKQISSQITKIKMEQWERVWLSR